MRHFMIGVLAAITFSMITTQFSLANAENPVAFLNTISDINTHKAAVTGQESNQGESLRNSASLFDNTVAAPAKIEEIESTKIPNSVGQQN